MADSIEYVIDATNHKLLDFRELWRFRELFYFFTWRDLKVKYKQTMLGVVWVMLQPLLMMVIFTFFFGRLLGISSEGLPYPIYALSGVILWTFFSASVTNAGNSMVLNAPIIKKIYFPRLIIPISSILASCVDLVVAFGLFIIMVIYYEVPVDLVNMLWLWPVSLLLGIIGAMGLGCWLSALMVKYRDFRFIVGFAMQVGFFLTPVVYPMNRIDYPYLKYLLAINPIYGAIALFRMPLSTIPIDIAPILISALTAVIFLFIGLAYFKKTELYFADLS